MSDALTKALAKAKDKPKKEKDSLSAAFKAFAEAMSKGDHADAEKAFRAAVAEASE